MMPWSRERVRRSCRARGMRMLLGLGLWLLCTVVLYFASLAPKPQTPNAFFMVCVWQSDTPALKLAADLGADDALCTQDVDYAAAQGYLRFYLRRDGDLMHLRTYNDSMADPLDYAYRVDGDKVAPLWWTHGGSLRKMVAGAYAILAAAIAFRLLLWLARRRRWRMGRWFEV